MDIHIDQLVKTVYSKLAPGFWIVVCSLLLINASMMIVSIVFLHQSTSLHHEMIEAVRSESHEIHLWRERTLAKEKTLGDYK